MLAAVVWLTTASFFVSRDCGDLVDECKTHSICRQIWYSYNRNCFIHRDRCYAQSKVLCLEAFEYLNYTPLSRCICANHFNGDADTRNSKRCFKRFLEIHHNPCIEDYAKSNDVQLLPRDQLAAEHYRTQIAGKPPHYYKGAWTTLPPIPRREFPGPETTIRPSTPSTAAQTQQVQPEIRPQVRPPQRPTTSPRETINGWRGTTTPAPQIPLPSRHVDPSLPRPATANPTPWINTETATTTPRIYPKVTTTTPWILEPDPTTWSPPRTSSAEPRRQILLPKTPAPPTSSTRRIRQLHSDDTHDDHDTWLKHLRVRLETTETQRKDDETDEVTERDHVDESSPRDRYPDQESHSGSEHPTRPASVNKNVPNQTMRPRTTWNPQVNTRLQVDSTIRPFVPWLDLSYETPSTTPKPSVVEEWVPTTSIRQQNSANPGSTPGQMTISTTRKPTTTSIRQRPTTYYGTTATGQQGSTSHQHATPIPVVYKKNHRYSVNKVGQFNMNADEPPRSGEFCSARVDTESRSIPIYVPLGRTKLLRETSSELQSCYTACSCEVLEQPVCRQIGCRDDSSHNICTYNNGKDKETLDWLAHLGRTGLCTCFGGEFICSKAEDFLGDSHKPSIYLLIGYSSFELEWLNRQVTDKKQRNLAQLPEIIQCSKDEELERKREEEKKDEDIEQIKEKCQAKNLFEALNQEMMKINENCQLDLRSIDGDNNLVLGVKVRIMNGLRKGYWSYANTDSSSENKVCARALHKLSAGLSGQLGHMLLFEPIKQKQILNTLPIAASSQLTCNLLAIIMTTLVWLI